MALFSTLMTHWISVVCQFQKVSFLTYGSVRPSYGTKATLDCHIWNWWHFGKSSARDGKMPESPIDRAKPSYKSISRWKWFDPLVMVSLYNSKRKMGGPSDRQDRSNEPSLNPSWNLLDNTFKGEGPEWSSPRSSHSSHVYTKMLDDVSLAFIIYFPTWPLVFPWGTLLWYLVYLVLIVIIFPGWLMTRTKSRFLYALIALL
jgi:hypothetical protein